MARPNKKTKNRAKSKAKKVDDTIAAAVTTASAANVDDTDANANDTDAPPTRDTNDNANNTTDTCPSPAAANSTSIMNVASNLHADDHPPPAATATSNIDYHNSLCETWGLGGEPLCCSTCILVFHVTCTRPQLNIIPKEEDTWRCPYFISDNTDASGEEQQLAHQHKGEIDGHGVMATNSTQT